MTTTIAPRPATHPRVIRISAPPTPAKAPGKRRAALALRLRNVIFGKPAMHGLLFLLVLGVLYASASAIWREADYVARQFKMAPAVLRLDDMSRMARGNMSLALATRAYGDLHAADPGGLAFGFSQAEMSYYGRAPFLSYFDKSALPLYKAQSGEELWRALRQRDIRYILQPPYPLPELNNSAFDPLLADPRFTAIAFEHGGARLMRVLIEPEQIAPRVLGWEGAPDKPLYASRWVVLSPGKPGESAASAIRTVPDGVAVKIPQRLFADRQRWDYIQRGLPVNNQPGAFLAPPGRLRISAQVTGKGRVDLLAVNLTADRATTADTLVWSGVLIGKRRTIAGQIITPTQAAGDGSGRRPMGLTFRAYRAGDITIHNWRVEWLPLAGQSDEGIEAATKPISSAAAKPVGPAAPAAFAAPATRQAEPPVSIAYVLRQPVNLEAAAVEALLAAKQVEARVVVDGANAPQSGTAYCADGRTLGLSLKPRDKSAADVLVPCWPRAVTLIWTSPRERGPARIIVQMPGAPERVVPLVALSDVLGEAPATRQARSAR